MPTPAACCPVFIERERELAVLARIADEVAGGLSQLVIVSGEAGAGKSRLAAEFIGALPAGWRTGAPGDAGSMRRLLDAGTPVVAVEHPEHELGAALADRLRSAEPSAVLVEDAHDLDPALIRALGITVEVLAEAPVLVVVTFRAGGLDRATSQAMTELRRQARVVDLSVGPLTRRGVAEMASALGRTLDPDRVDEVLRRSGGNAFFVEELLLAGDAPSWTLTHTVLERVRAVDTPGRRVAELLAVAGGRLSRAVIETAARDGAAGVAALLGAGIAVVSGDDAVALRHALVGEIVETHLSLAERTSWHATLAACLIKRRAAPAATIARHLLAAGDPGQAARWATIAADDAAAARTFVTASSLYAIALSAPPAEPMAHAELLERAAVAAGWSGASSTALIRATLADARFREAGEPWRAQAMWLNPTLRHLPKPPLEGPAPEGGDVASLLVASERACLDGDHGRGAALARHSLQLARLPNAEPSWATEAAYRLVRCGARAEGDTALQQQLVAATVAGDDVLVARSASMLTEAALTWGDIDLAISYHRRAMAAVARTGHPSWALEVGQALLDACRGDFDDSERRLVPLLAGDVPIATEFAQLPAAWIDLERGDLARVGERIARMRAVRSLGVATFTMSVLLIEARWRERVGDPQGALDALDEADRVNGDLFEPGRPDRLILRARVASQLGDRATISQAHRELDELVERGGATLVRGGAAWALGLWAHHTGQPREARLRLQAAAEMCEQASRFVLAVEAWCDLATTATADDAGDADARRLACERAKQIARRGGFSALLARVDALDASDRGQPAWPPAFEPLTPRQRDIALLVAAGRTNRQIGQQLYLSEHTVRNQLVDVFNRLGIARRTELSALAAATARHPADPI